MARPVDCRSRGRFALALAAALAAAAAPAWAIGRRPKCDGPGESPPVELAVTERGSLGIESASSPPAGAPPALRYRRLALRDCQCLAVRFAPLADSLARERARLAAAHPCCDKPWVRCLLPCHCDDRALQMRITILCFTEQDLRNRSAGLALDLLLRVAEYEAKADLLAEATAALTGAHAQARDFVERGFKLPIELASLERQRLEVEADRIRVQGTIDELNSRVKSLIGHGALPINERLWPIADWTVAGAPRDAEDAIRLALDQRAELQLLRRLNCDLDAKSLPVVREFLKSAHPAMGAPAGSNSPIIRMFEGLCSLVTRQAAERSMRGGQLQQLLSDREAAVADEVRQALAAMAMYERLIELDRRRADQWRERVEEQKDRSERGLATFLDVLQAELEWRKVRAALVADVVGWHRALAQLRTAQGSLVCECAGEIDQ